ncbi:hypothetical protein EYF80_014817 [Liparis tanakae]|uniref:Uncharacterized protein n=1 Tax=Liparis tanakae TaxID=230148 RepID=A0A4Z2I9Z2_9TELE|nr:hypothetical protein EYF80_014817 [Liparis tanakae]
MSSSNPAGRCDRLLKPSEPFCFFSLPESSNNKRKKERNHTWAYSSQHSSSSSSSFYSPSSSFPSTHFICIDNVWSCGGFFFFFKDASEKGTYARCHGGVNPGPPVEACSHSRGLSGPCDL